MNRVIDDDNLNPDWFHVGAKYPADLEYGFDQRDILTQTPPFPNFFVIGAPRCGTTAICRYLARNPQICLSRPKEPHYFSRLDHDPSMAELKRDYLDPCFGHYEETHKALGEGSVSYLYLPGVIERITQFNPDSRFIVLVRNPLSMLPSYHLRMQFLLQEDEPDFARAWEFESERERGNHIPKRCLDTRLLLYSQAAQFGVQVERLFDVAGRERSHVIVFDDLKSDPLSVYRAALGFLNVDYDGQTEFERRYESRMYRYGWLQRLFFVPATKTGPAVDTLERRTRKYNEDGTRHRGLLKRMTDFNRVPMSPRPLTPQMVERVSETLRPDVMRLSQLIGRDLSFWLED